MKNAISIIKSNAYYQIIRDKTLTPYEKQNKIAKLNEMFKDNIFILECMKVCKKALEQGIIEMESEIKNGK